MFWMKGAPVQLVLTTLYTGLDFPSVMLAVRSPWVTAHSLFTQGCGEKQGSSLPSPDFRSEDPDFPHLPWQITHYNHCVHSTT